MREDGIEPIGTHANMTLSLVERLLSIPSNLGPVDHAEEFVERAAHAAAAALGVDFAINWFGLARESLPSLSSNMARLMVLQQDVSFAAIDLIGREAFAPQDEIVLDHLARDLTLSLDAFTYRKIRDAQRALIAILSDEDDPAELAKNATIMFVEQVGAEAGLLLSQHTSSFGVVASVGDWPAEHDAIADWNSVAQRGIRAGGALAHPGGLVTCPIAASTPARILLLLRFPLGRATRRSRFPVLEELTRAAAPYMNARRRDMVLLQLLELNRAAEDTDTIELYRSVLRTAVELIPGSQAGTFLARHHPGEPFQYQAALGFDLDALRGSTVNEAAMRAWYGPNDRGWRLGQPRILSRDSVDIDTYGAAASPDADPEATAYGSIQSNLCLPVLRDGVVMAALNLDNLTDPQAFGRDSTRLARLFGSPLSSLLYRQHTHNLLQKAALIDELTNLANRRAFDQALERELARAVRTGSQPSVLLLDVRGFKLINDRFGHAVGDEALILVARALEEGLRATDLPARYGGDEFVAMLPETPASEATFIAQRVQGAIANIIIRDDVSLAVDIGIATAPADGSTVKELVRVADERMYVEKLAAR